MQLLKFLDKFDKFIRITADDFDMYMYKENCLKNCSGNRTWTWEVHHKISIAMGGHLPKLDQIGRFETNASICSKSQTIPGGIYCSGNSTVTNM